MLPTHASRPADPGSATSLQARFLHVLPRIEAHAKFRFRDVRCPSRQEDLIQESVAVAWESFRQASEKGKNPTEFASAIARYAVLHVRSHRNLCGSERAKDVLSPLAQHRHGFEATSYTCASAVTPGRWQEALQHNRQTPVPEQASFKIDFPRWLAQLDPRSRRMAEELMLGCSAGEVAHRFGLSPARVSQIRRELHDDWERFCDGVPAGRGQPVAC